jgi:hypothetical protein
MSALLTVAIPTYNRNEQLARSLGRLLPQLDDRCEVLLLDNHSKIPVADTLRPLLASRPDLKVRIIRHPANVGMSANILRCFESCNTEWIWVLGDDDAVRVNAYRTVCRAIEENPGHLAVTFRLEALPAECPEPVTQHTQLFAAENLFTAMIFLSSTVYRSDLMKRGLAEAHEYCGTFAPHSALLLLGLSRHGAPVACCPECIVDWRAAEEGERYSMFFAFKLAGLLALVDPAADSLARRSLLGLMTPVRRLLLHCLRDLHDEADRFSVATVFREYVQVMARLEGGMSGKMRALFWRILFNVTATFPKLTFRICASFYRRFRGVLLRDSMQKNRICRNIMRRLADEPHEVTDPSIS